MGGKKLLLARFYVRFYTQLQTGKKNAYALFTKSTEVLSHMDGGIDP